MTNSGHAFDDFRNLWPYSYVNKSAGTNVLPWAKTNNLSWAGQDGVTPTFGTGNRETMFVQRFSFGDWNWGYGNMHQTDFAYFLAFRDNSLVPFAQGRDGVL
jgi:hypothetical protein